MATATPSHYLRLLSGGHLDQLGGQVVAVAAALLVAAVLLLGVNVSVQQKNFAWIAESESELIQISEVDKRLLANELTVRGYALTGDPVFLAYHANEERQMRAAVDTLGRLFENDPPEVKQRFAELRKLVDQRLATFAQLIGLGPGHAKEVAATIVDPNVRAVMRAARAKVTELRDAEMQELAERQEAAERQVERTYVTAVIIVFLAFALGVAGIAMQRFARVKG